MSEVGFVTNFVKFCASLVIHYIVASFFLVLNSTSFVLNQYQLYFGDREVIATEKVSKVYHISFIMHSLHVLRGQNAVVITGCDSGFGEATSIRLAQMGFHVVSACYTSEGAARLNGTVALAVVCDVTKEEDVAALVEHTAQLLTAKKLKLWGLVCNAG